QIGYNGGAWNNIGINSSVAAADATKSTAIGIGESATILGGGGGIFDGIAVDATALLLKYTYYGDANLSGNVDTIDFNILAASFAKTGKYWASGDFDWSTIVDTIDFNRLASNFAKLPVLAPVVSQPTPPGTPPPVIDREPAPDAPGDVLPPIVGPRT